MEDIIPLGFPIVLLIVTLYVVLGFLATPLAILRRAGIWRAARWVLRTLFRALVGLVRIPIRILNSRRRGRPRRAIPLGRAVVRLFK